MSLSACAFAIASRGCQAQRTLTRTFEKASRASTEPTQQSPLAHRPAANWRRGQGAAARLVLIVIFNASCI